MPSYSHMYTITSILCVYTICENFSLLQNKKHKNNVQMWKCVLTENKNLNMVSLYLFGCLSLREHCLGWPLIYESIKLLLENCQSTVLYICELYDPMAYKIN